MNLRSFVRDLLLVLAAVAIGWWLHGRDGTVFAQRSSSSSSARGAGSEANLAFQFYGNGQDQALAMYNPANHTLYVYPHVGQSNSHISCAYSFTIDRPGGPMDRQNCPLGEQVQIQHRLAGPAPLPSEAASGLERIPAAVPQHAEPHGRHLRTDPHSPPPAGQELC